MAITEIHAIESTPHLALAYIRGDKIISLADDTQISKDFRHYVFEENGKKFIGLPVLSSYQNCNIDNPMSSYKKRADYGRGRLRKETPRTKSGKEIFMWHLVQSFPEKISPAMANEIGQTLAAEVFGNFTVTISTHTNTEHIHNHLMISAWDMDGRKWHDCHATKRQIRTVSDRLCTEYGLSVLENTRDMRLVKYQDTQGKTRYYEPTDRKNQLIRNREHGQVPDATGSYRHSAQHGIFQAKTESNKEMVRRDIDTLLPYARSYEELLSSLRALGYKIKDKKKNGDYLAHVTFQTMGQEKGVRDSSLGDGRFYSREQLTRYISKQQEKVIYHEDIRQNAPSSVPCFETYEYGTTDLRLIDDNFRAEKRVDGSYIVQRSDKEKVLLSDIRMKDEQVRGLIDTTRLKEIIVHQAKGESSHRKEEQLVAQIQSSFQCLRFIENHHIYNYRQMFDLYKSNKEKYDHSVELFEKSAMGIAKLKESAEIPKLKETLEHKIVQNKNDIGYILEQYSHDKKQLEQYQDAMQRYHIDTPESLAALREKISAFTTKQEQNHRYLQKITNTMSELENCVNTFARIDHDNGKMEHEVVKAFKAFVSAPSKRRKGYNQDKSSR